MLKERQLYEALAELRVKETVVIPNDVFREMLWAVHVAEKVVKADDDGGSSSTEEVGRQLGFLKTALNDLWTRAGGHLGSR